MVAMMDPGQSGDAASAFEEIYDQYAARLYNHIYRFTEERAQAEDLLQDTFVKVYRHLGQIPAGPQRRPYLYRMAHNVCIDWLRGRRPEVASSRADDEDDPPGPVTDADLITDGYCLKEDLERALSDVPLSLRVPLLLYAMDELTYSEIAGVLDITVAAAKMRVSRARDLVRQAYRRGREGSDR
jgi:RNA polymerase sigma-70 factor (ECF subfamily)